MLAGFIVSEKAQSWRQSQTQRRTTTLAKGYRLSTDSLYQVHGIHDIYACFMHRYTVTVTDNDTYVQTHHTQATHRLRGHRNVIPTNTKTRIYVYTHLRHGYNHKQKNVTPTDIQLRTRLRCRCNWRFHFIFFFS